MMIRLICSIVAVVALALSGSSESVAQESWWQGHERTIRYAPDGGDFVIRNGERRFNRALYGTHTAFRVEAGDLPEFALYMPGVGGNFKLGLITATDSKWVIDAEAIEARYRPGMMLYTVKDPILGNATLNIQVLALADAEGLVVQTDVVGEVPASLRLLTVFGGASGKTFSRAGDIGADPESGFYLHPEYCEGNQYKLSKNTFSLTYVNGRRGPKELIGQYPKQAVLKLADAGSQTSPATLSASGESSQPLLTAMLKPKSGQAYHYVIQVNEAGKQPRLDGVQAFRDAAQKRAELASRIKINTPDPYINTLGGALAVAADGIWEHPTYLHGAVAWRMRLNAWRGAYVADMLGWHDRAQAHFGSYANSQVIKPESAPVVMDTALHLARHIEEMGTAMFSSGYISRNPNDNTRPHHYDMNLVFFDQILTHFRWTGDTDFLRKIWPNIKRHLAWEKRNFDMDGDGLYDAYCAIWASDGLQYSGGGVTHTSSYNYRANKIAAELAELLGEDGTPYRQEAEKIHQALNSRLWLPQKGWYAEYQDLLGNQLLHETPGLWTIYHAIDSEVPNPFQTYQSLRYIDNHIPHIPIRAHGLNEDKLYTLSTTNWQPYTWSVNNVALAEVLHTSLAYWQGGRPEQAFQLWRSSLIESMFLGASPGNFQQLSFYDARRGELYRDFADPIGVASRTVVEGLFGVKPDALKGVLQIAPGLPAAWEYASFESPNVQLDYKKEGNVDKYTIVPNFQLNMSLQFSLPVKSSNIREIKVNGQRTDWKNDTQAIGNPKIIIEVPAAERYDIEVLWGEQAVEQLNYSASIVGGSDIELTTKTAAIKTWYDPQEVLAGAKNEANQWKATLTAKAGYYTFFVQLEQDGLTWWQPVDIEIVDGVRILHEREQSDAGIKFTLHNGGPEKQIRVLVNSVAEHAHLLKLPENGKLDVSIPSEQVIWGTNVIRILSETTNEELAKAHIIHWDGGISVVNSRYQTVDMDSYFNERVDQIFEQKYLSPRPTSPALQLPWQGIGNWCYPLISAEIDDSGLRRLAGSRHEIVLPGGVPVRTSGAPETKNIVYTSQWDNYPTETTISLPQTKASHAYFLMAGSTNPMQSHMDNAELIVTYQDGSEDRLALRNPQNWWSIEQDFYIDDHAFDTQVPHPYRVHLKTGKIVRESDDYVEIKGFTLRAIDGGAATVLDIPLQAGKVLEKLTLRTITNDVVVGLMGITLKLSENE